jgi:hypothetical protein
MLVNRKAAERPQSTSPKAVRSTAHRSPWKLPIAAFAIAFAFVLVLVVDPYSGAYADGVTAPNHWQARDSQSYSVDGQYATATVSHDAYSVQMPAPVIVNAAPKPVTGHAPAAGTPDPGTAQAIALSILTARGMGSDQYSCLVSLWNRESHWNVYASNASGAYGIPQALPGSKMASAGPNWQSDPTTQITWGLGYITGRYGTPCGAWAHSQSSGWY